MDGQVFAGPDPIKVYNEIKSYVKLNSKWNNTLHPESPSSPQYVPSFPSPRPDSPPPSPVLLRPDSPPHRQPISTTSSGLARFKRVFNPFARFGNSGTETAQGRPSFEHSLAKDRREVKLEGHAHEAYVTTRMAKRYKS